MKTVILELELDNQRELSPEEIEKDLRMAENQIGWNYDYSIKSVEVKDFQTEDVKPVVRRKWVPHYDYAEPIDGSTLFAMPQIFQDGWQCSLCGWYMMSQSNFCPNCGADMRGE